MKNVTITLDERTALWARVEPATAGKSLSRWIGDHLDDLRRRGQPDEAPDWIDQPLWPSAPEPLPSRPRLYEGQYDRPGFRGHERADLQPGRASP